MSRLAMPTPRASSSTASIRISASSGLETSANGVPGSGHGDRTHDRTLPFGN